MTRSMMDKSGMSYRNAPQQSDWQSSDHAEEKRRRRERLEQKNQKSRKRRNGRTPESNQKASRGKRSRRPAAMWYDVDDYDELLDEEWTEDDGDE